MVSLESTTVAVLYSSRTYLIFIRVPSTERRQTACVTRLMDFGARAHADSKRTRVRGLVNQERRVEEIEEDSVPTGDEGRHPEPT